MAAKEPITELELKKQEKDFKKYLESCEKVPIEIPDDPNNPDDVVPVGINGVIYAIPRGRQFEVPKPIYDTWRYSYEKTKEANAKAKKMLNGQLKDVEIW